jgi:molecular chaperone GrpE
VTDQGDPRDPDAPDSGPVIRDRRKIDPVTGQIRDLGPRPSAPGSGPAGPASTGAGAGADTPADPAADQLARELEDVRAKEAALVDDLKRVQAEYVNYRRRVDRDRDVSREMAVAGVLETLLPVLDDIGRARDHGDLDGAFKTVAENLEATVTRLGLTRYGQAGDEFDPAVHEALMHEMSDDVSVPTCTQILFPGYRVGERILRAARVAVAEPDS